MSARDTRSRLLRRAAKSDLTVPPALAGRLAAYLDLLFRWNRKINLTALDEVDQAIDRLLLEPLAAARHIPTGPGRLIDIGSGGGSPAIPLALALDLDLTMVETKARKSAFLREAVRVLDMPRALVETGRFEDLLERHGQSGAYTALSARAIRVEAATLRRFSDFLGPDGVALIFRGASGPDQVPDVDPLTWTGTYRLIESLGSRLTVYRRVR